MGFVAQAAELLRNPGQLHRVPGGRNYPEKMLRVEGARVVRLHYDRIRRDFPNATLGKTNQQIREMILDCVEFISQSQTEHTEVNTPIPLAAERPGRPQTRIAYRPPSYGRAVVYECMDGMIDAKGTGTGTGMSPSAGEHKTGLFELERALREDLLESVVGMILKHEGYQAGTVESYGTVYLNFQAKSPQGVLPAGLALRQSHSRGGKARWDGYWAEVGQKVEAILRKYGFTSDPKHYVYGMELEARRARGEVDPRYQVYHTIDRQNVQLDKNGAVFDFETIMGVPGFSSSPVNPDPKLRLPLDVWSGSRINQWARDLAMKIRDGQIDEVGVNAEYEKLLAPVRKHLANCSETIRELVPAL